MVRCGDPLNDEAVVVRDALVLVEDISPASVGTDAGAKLADYFRLPSLRYYLMVDLGRRTVVTTNAVKTASDLATQLAAWQGFYNHRPHGALGAGTPAEQIA